MSYSQSQTVADNEWLTVEEISSGGRPRRLDALSDQRTGMRTKKPSNRSVHSFGHKDYHGTRDRPSIGRRVRRTLFRFFMAVLIGVGITVGWQSYGDAVREMVAVRAPTLAWLLSISTTKPPVVTATSPGLVQPLEPLASNLDVVRHSVEQLAAKQEQMAQNIATLQAVEEDIKAKMSFTPLAQQAAPLVQNQPPQPKAPATAPRKKPLAGPASLSHQ